MCDSGTAKKVLPFAGPAGLIPLAGVLGYEEKKKAASKQNAANDKMKELNAKAHLQNQVQLAFNSAIAKDSTNSKINNLTAKNIKTKSMTKLSATENRVGGISIKGLLNDYSRQLGTQKESINKDLNNQLSGLEMQSRGQAISIAMSNAGIINRQAPNPWAYGLNYGLDVGMKLLPFAL